jgi:hypothetical protein
VRARRKVGLASDNRFHPGARRFLVKFDRAEKIAVIGHGHGRHAEFDRFFHQLLHPHRAVEQGIFGVKVEVNERITRHQLSIDLREISQKISRVIAKISCLQSQDRIGKRARAALSFL